jgi:hypothetical protein
MVEQEYKRILQVCNRRTLHPLLRWKGDRVHDFSSFSSVRLTDSLLNVGVLTNTSTKQLLNELPLVFPAEP